MAARIAHVMRPNQYNRSYLETKAVRSGHYIDFEGKEHLPEQAEPLLVKSRSSAPGSSRPGVSIGTIAV